MAEYIERGALTLLAYKSGDYGHPAVVDLEDIAEVPAADVVPVVRCKDCTYRDDAYVCNGFLICPASNMEIADNDFCSYGERKGGDYDV